MKKAILVLTSLVLAPLAEAGYDCHLGRDGQQDSVQLYYSCQTGLDDYAQAERACTAVCKARGCDVFYVNTYAPSQRACEASAR